MKKIFYAVLFFSALIFAGCASKDAPIAKEEALPSWYDNPPLSNSSTLYALGESTDKKSALAEALSLMASTLSVSVESEFDSQKKVKDGYAYDSTVVSRVKSRVDEITISNYEILAYKELGFKRYAVLIKAQKRDILHGIKKELEHKFAMIGQKEDTLLLLSSIERLGEIKKLLSDTSDVPYMLRVASSLDRGFDTKTYMKKLSELKSAYDVLLSKITFSIECDESAAALEGVLAKWLSGKNIRIKESGGKDHFRIKVSLSSVDGLDYGIFASKAAIVITTEENGGTKLGVNKIDVTGHSSQNNAAAKDNMVVKFGEMIEKEGIGSIIGLDI